MTTGAAFFGRFARVFKEFSILWVAMGGDHGGGHGDHGAMGMATGAAFFGSFASVFKAFSQLWAAMGVTTGSLFWSFCWCFECIFATLGGHGGDHGGGHGTKPTSRGHAPVYVKLQNEAFRILVPFWG